jgi:hypothetical protein
MFPLRSHTDCFTLDFSSPQRSPSLFAPWSWLPVSSASSLAAKVPLTSDDGATNTGPVLGVVRDDVLALLAEDVHQSLVDPVGKVGVFLQSATFQT